METQELLDILSPPVRNWFVDKFSDFTEPQKIAIPRILNGEHLLLCSPTGSGKTLTAFLTIIDDLVRRSLDGTLPDTVQCIYISPIKALANDIQKNLIGPLSEIKERFLPSRAKDIKIALRTGDTPQNEREKMLRRPPHILITTPESLGLILASKRWRPNLKDLKWMIIDEMHSLVPNKRGTHLSLSLALMDTVVSSEVQRIGISATMEPLDDVAEFLVASDPRESDMEPQRVSIANVSGSREIDLDIILPTARFSSIPIKEILDHNIDRIKELVEAHTTTLVFVNTRNMTETVVQRLKIAGLEGVEGHHGSMDKTIRLDVERRHIVPGACRHRRHQTEVGANLQHAADRKVLQQRDLKPLMGNTFFAVITVPRVPEAGVVGAGFCHRGGTGAGRQTLEVNVMIDGKKTWSALEKYAGIKI